MHQKSGFCFCTISANCSFMNSNRKTSAFGDTSTILTALRASFDSLAANMGAIQNVNNAHTIIKTPNPTMLPMNSFRIMLSFPVGIQRRIRIIKAAIPVTIPTITPHVATIFSAELLALAASKCVLHMGTLICTVADLVPWEKTWLTPYCLDAGDMQTTHVGGNFS